jgi:hypothetical protein
MILSILQLARGSAPDVFVALLRCFSGWHAGGRTTDFFWCRVLPHECGVPPGLGTPHLCGSEEFCHAPIPARPPF